MKEFIIFICTDYTEIFFSKLRSSGLNYNLPSFFTDCYCAGGGGGVSNKHCLLTFFISPNYCISFSEDGFFVLANSADAVEMQHYCKFRNFGEGFIFAKLNICEVS